LSKEETITRILAQHSASIDADSDACCTQTIEHCILIICLLRLLEGSPARTATLERDEVAYDACPAGMLQVGVRLCIPYLNSLDAVLVAV